MGLTPTQIARATLTDTHARQYLALTHRKLSDWRNRGQLSEARAIRLLRNNARDGRRVLGQRCGADDTLDRAAAMLYRAWIESQTE